MTPPTVNAYYNAFQNNINFPAGILQPPFYENTMDDAVNFGGIGVVIGHEFTHGFDDQGSKYDADGNLREWWTPDDRRDYEARTDLMVRQFEGYEALPGLRLNGELTLGENIADLGGLKVAFAAFRRALARTGDPGASEGFTAAQRFFLGYAQAWRTLLRDEQARLRVYVDPHAPPRFRVNGPLANLPEFHEAFACGEGAAMWRAPEARPTIW
jgi:predicted metalloendopeptidase